MLVYDEHLFMPQRIKSLHLDIFSPFFNDISLSSLFLNTKCVNLTKPKHISSEGVKTTFFLSVEKKGFMVVDF